MGGGGGKKQDKPSVEYAQPLDFSALMAQANAGAIEAMQAQIDAQIKAYPEMEKLQLGTINRISNRLGRSQFTKDARGQIRGAISDTNRVRGIGQLLQDQAGPTSIEQSLYDQAEAELALGRSLSPEEQRAAEQSARGAFAARGLGTGAGSAAAELLNREGAASAREAQRRNFAAATNQMYTGNITGRLGQAAGVLGQSAGMGQANAGLLVNTDPYQRALGFAGIGSTIGTNLTNMTGNTWQGAQQMAGNVASFNASMLDGRANTAMNNWSAMQAARINAGASQNAGMMGMFGGIGGGALAAGGSIGMGLAI